MEIPIQVAVRIRPPPPPPSAQPNTNNTNNNNNTTTNQTVVVKSIPGLTGPGSGCDPNGNNSAAASAPVSSNFPPTSGLITVDTSSVDGAASANRPETFLFSCTLPELCSQDQLYMQCVYPRLGMYLEGFDASFVTYGQRGSGKTYTMMGAEAEAEGQERGENPGAAAAAAVAEQTGIVQRCVRDIFGLLAMHRERTYVLNIGWVVVRDDRIHDLLDNSGNVACQSEEDVLHWLRVGVRNRASCEAEEVEEGGEEGREKRDAAAAVHSIFTLTLEQHWVADGMIQHRLSTASFCDLAGTERRIGGGAEMDNELRVDGVPADAGLQVLDEIVADLTADPASPLPPPSPPYPRTTLTTLLKDSFGGRAQTLLILCVSPLAADLHETLHNLRFAYRSQCIRNYVVLNAFSDNNTPLAAALEAAAAAAAAAQSELAGPLAAGCDHLPSAAELVHQHQFAAAQWLKLVSNAEGLFSRLIATESLGAKERARIEEWMFLKQECHECLSSGELHASGDDRLPIAAPQQQQQQLLGPIQEEEGSDREAEDDDEDDEDDDVDDDDDDDDDDEEMRTTGSQQLTDSDSESQALEDLQDRMAQLMDEFRIKTDTLVADNYAQFVGQQPQAVLASGDGPKAAEGDLPLAEAAAEAAGSPSITHRSAGRRKSIQPGATALSSRDIARLNAVAAETDAAAAAGIHASATTSAAPPLPPHIDSSADELLLLRSVARDPLERLDCELRQVRADICAAERQALELAGTLETTTELAQSLAKRATSQNRVGFNKRRAKLEADAAKAQKALGKACAAAHKNGGGTAAAAELDRLQAAAHAKRQLCAEFVALNSAEELQLKCKQHQKAAKAAKKRLDAVQKGVKKARKLEAELVAERAKLVAKDAAQLAKVTAAAATAAAPRDVAARIHHLDAVIKEKAAADSAIGGGELFRHEIRQLRRTRDELLEQRCQIDRKLKRDRRLSADEQRRLCEYDEGIEAIDTAIEYKNELLGAAGEGVGRRKSVELGGGGGGGGGTSATQRERGGRMLMARLNNLSVEEMRVLLYKYFQKAIDFRDTSVQMERDRDFWEQRARQLHHEVQRVRFEAERRAAVLQQQQEAKLAMYMRHLNGASGGSGGGGMSESMGSGSGGVASTVDSVQMLALGRQQQQQPQPQPQSHRMHSRFHGQLEAVGGGVGGGEMDSYAAKYKPLDKYKAQLEKEKSAAAATATSSASTSKFFSKIQMFKTQYRGGSAATGSGGPSSKVHDASMTLAEQQLRHLRPARAAIAAAAGAIGGGGMATTSTGTKVTREKNKLVIQQQSGGGR